MKLKYGIVLILLLLALPMIVDTAFAVATDVAKKCQALQTKAFPFRVPGNPAAGLMHGTGREAAAYLRKCMENGGNVEGSGKEQAPQGTK